MTAEVDRDVEDLLLLFTEKLKTSDSEHPEQTDISHVSYRADRRQVLLTFQGQDFVLHFHEEPLARHLADASDYGPDLWGTTITPLEAAANLLLVHLDASLATRVPHPSGAWTHVPGGFAPRPPWERRPHH